MGSHHHLSPTSKFSRVMLSGECVTGEVLFLWCHQDSSQNFPQVDPCSPLFFSDRCGPYWTPQTRALLSTAIFSTGVWMMGIFLFRQTLKFLLSYHGWMFEMHGQTSHFTKIWAVSRSQWWGSD